MNLQKTLKYSVLSGIFLIPFVGLITSSAFFFPYITPKNLAFRLIVLVILGAYFLLAYTDKNYRPVIGKIGVAVSLFVGVMFVADLFGVAPMKSFFSNFERMEGFFTLALLLAFFVVMSSVLKEAKVWTRLFKASLVSSILMGLYALVESSQGVDRLAAQLGNSTYLGVFMLFNVFIGILLLVRLIENKHKEVELKWMGAITYLGIILFDFYILYRSGTRSALLGLIAGFIFASILFAFFQKKSKSLKIFGLAVLTLVIISVGSLYVFRESEVVKSNGLLNRFAGLISAPTDIKNYLDTEGRGRLGIWSLAIEGVKEKPILGWGQDNFNYIFNEYYKAELYGQEQWFDRAHNVFLDWLTAGGILGLLSYLLIFVTAFVSLWKSKERFSFEDKAILTALLIAYFIHNLFVFDSITSYILFFTLLAYIAHQGETKTKTIPLSASGASVGVILSVVGLYYLVILPFISSTVLIDALVAQNQSKVSEALSSYQKAIKYGIVGTSEAREQLLQATPNIAASSKINDEVKIAFIEETDKQIALQIEQFPEDARYQLFAGAYFSRTGRMTEAENYFLKAEALSPEKQSIYFEHAVGYMNVGNYKKATEIMKYSYDLAPQNDAAAALYAVALIYTGDNKTADDLLAPYKNTKIGTDNRLLKAYYDTKQNTKIFGILQQKLNIASEYIKAGDRQNAIAEIQEVISINPAFKAEGEALIKNI